jgi:hypothetical protein
MLVTNPYPPINEDAYSLTQSEGVIVQQQQQSKHYFVVVAIYSDLVSKDRRDAIRETWMRLYKQEEKYEVLYKFVIEQPSCLYLQSKCDPETIALEQKLAEEENTYQDIQRLDIHNEQTQKIGRVMEWAATLDFDYFIKTDHDVFVRIDTILLELQGFGPRLKYWTGFVWRNIPPVASTTDNTKGVTYELGKYPPYTAGTLHILSSDLVQGLSSPLPRRQYQNEDQSLGIWLFPFNVTPIHDPRIQQWDVCHKYMLVKHPMTPAAMRKMYMNVIDSDNMCQNFATHVCPLCWPCGPEHTYDWRSEGTIQCDREGATLQVPSILNPKIQNPDKVLAGLLDYLPHVICPPAKLDDSQKLHHNMVNNGNFVSLDGWIQHGDVKLVDDDGVFEMGAAPSKAVMFTLLSTTSYDIAYVKQEVIVNQDEAEVLIFSFWTKSLNVEPLAEVGDYSLYADIYYQDGSNEWGYDVELPSGTRNWTYVAHAFTPRGLVSKIDIYCMFRYTRGTAWFDKISITKISDKLCELKHQSTYYNTFTPQTLLPALPAPSSSPTFIVIWTTSTASFRLRHRRVIESIFFHHPDARIRMYSNTLPAHFFSNFNDAGYNIEVINYDLTTLGAGLPGEKWVQRISDWSKGESFYAHLADYLRFVLLYKEGGVYTDMDSILIKPVTNADNVIGSEYCDQETLTYCVHLPQFREDRRFYLPIGFLVLTKEHPLMHQALTYFDTIYNPDLWPCGTVYLTYAYTKLYLNETSAAPVEVLPRDAFYPVPWQKVLPYFTTDDAKLWKDIRNKSYAFHVWGKMTEQHVAVPGSLLHHVLNDFSLSDLPTSELSL